MPAWSPADLSGSLLNRWIPAGAMSRTGTTVTGGTTADSSATAITLVGTGATYNATGLNGQPTLTLGGNNLMQLTADIGYDCTIIGVLKPTAYGNYHNVYEQSGAACPMLWMDSANRYSMNGGGSVIEPSSPTADGSTWRIVANINRDDGNAIRAEERIDGNTGTSGGVSVGAINIGTGRTINLFGRDTSSGMRGDFAEMVITYGPLSDADLYRLEGYLAWKYGLQSQLPSGHTYHAAAPTTGSGSVYDLSISESVTSDFSLSTTVGYGESVSESVTSDFSLLTGAAYDESVSESVSPVFSVGTLALYVAPTSEGVSLLDSLGTVGTFGLPVTEAISPAMSPMAAAIFPSQLAEAVDVGLSVTASVALPDLSPYRARVRLRRRRMLIELQGG